MEVFICFRDDARKIIREFHMGLLNLCEVQMTQKPPTPVLSYCGVLSVWVNSRFFFIQHSMSAIVRKVLNSNWVPTGVGVNIGRFFNQCSISSIVYKVLSSNWVPTGVGAKRTQEKVVGSSPICKMTGFSNVTMC